MYWIKKGVSKTDSQIAKGETKKKKNQINAENLAYNQCHRFIIRKTISSERDFFCVTAIGIKRSKDSTHHNMQLWLIRVHGQKGNA